MSKGCYQCEDRKPNCHSTCETYKKFLEKVKRAREKRRKEYASSNFDSTYRRKSEIERKAHKS